MDEKNENAYTHILVEKKIFLSHKKAFILYLEFSLQTIRNGTVNIFRGKEKKNIEQLLNFLHFYFFFKKA